MKTLSNITLARGHWISMSKRKDMAEARVDAFISAVNSSTLSSFLGTHDSSSTNGDFWRNLNTRKNPLIETLLWPIRSRETAIAETRGRQDLAN
jgi:hypothetical protein